MNSYRKGYRGETELAKLLSAMFGVEVRRGAAPRLPGFIAPDVCGLPGVHVEIKRREKLSLPAALRQAAFDAGPDIPIVAHRANGEQWLVTCRLIDWPELAQKVSKLLSKQT